MEAKLSQNTAPNRRTASKLPRTADFQTEEEFQRLRPGRRGPDGTVKQQLIGKLGPGGFGRLLERVRRQA